MVARGAARLLLLAVASARPAPAPAPGSKRLVVLSGPRTGSSLLVAMLRAHRRQILMHGEPFHQYDLRTSDKDGFDGDVEVPDDVFAARRSEPLRLLDHMAAHHRGREIVGFKLFQKHMRTKQLPDFLKWATHLVWLSRDNELAQYVSVCLAQKGGVWVQYDEARESARNVTLSDDFFRLWIHAEKQFMSYAQGIVSLLEVDGAAPAVLRLTYERDLCSLDLYNRTMGKLEAFLGLGPTDAAPRLPVKQHGEVLADLVTNWDEPYVQEIAARYAHLPTTCAKPKPTLDELLAAGGGGFWRRRLDADDPDRGRRKGRRLETDHGLCIEGREQRNGFGGGI